MLDTSIIEISNKDPNTREITLIAHKLDIANDNGLDFKEEYTKKHMNSLINKPLVCSYYTVSDDLGTHEEIRDQNGNVVELRTIAIGTITDVWIDNLETNNRTSRALYCKGKVWSYKYPQIMNCIENSYNNRNQTSSIEVEIMEYESNPTMQYRAAKEYSYLGLCLLGKDVRPADKDSGVISIFQKEVAMAVSNDLGLGLNINTNKGGNVVADEKEIQFNYGKEMNIYFELSAMSHDDIRSALWNAVNPKDSDGNRDYKYWIRDVFNSYVIVSEWETDESFKINYTINESDNSVTVDKSSAIKVKQEWVEVTTTTVTVNDEMENKIKELESKLELKEKEIEELNAEKEEQLNKFNQKESEFNSLIEEKTSLENKIKELSTADTELNELQSKVENLQKEINSKEEALNNTKQTTNEEIIKLGLVINELKEQLSQLKPIKEEFDKLQAEKQEVELNEKRNSLKQFALNSKFVEEKEFAENEEIKQAIMEVNEAKIKDIIASRVVEKAIQETDNKINSNNSDVIINAKNPEDLNLLPTSVKEEMFAPVGRK